MARIGSNAGEQLRCAIWANFANFPGRVAIEELSGRTWASVTFSGERHRLRLRLQGEAAGAAAETFLAGLGERAFDLRGHVLADIALVSDDRDEAGRLVRLALEALTIEAS